MSVERMQRGSGEVVCHVLIERLAPTVHRRELAGPPAPLDLSIEGISVALAPQHLRAVAPADVAPANPPREIYSSAYDRHIGPRLDEMQLTGVWSQAHAAHLAKRTPVISVPHRSSFASLETPEKP